MTCQSAGTNAPRGTAQARHVLAGRAAGREEFVQTLILTLHIIVCVLLVILILLQSGKEGMGVIFGGGGNTSVFGSSGAGGILAKLTTLMAIIFVITSLSYTYVTSARPSNESTILNVKIEEPEAPAQAAPAVPEAPAPKAPAPNGSAPDAKAPGAGEAPAGTPDPQKP